MKATRIQQLTLPTPLCPHAAVHSCVGRANMRPFILFLSWVILSAIYIMGLCLTVLYSNRAGLRHTAAQARLHAQAARQHSGSGSWADRLTNTLVPVFVVVSSIPWWLLCACYLLVVAVALLLCMGVLLGSQLRLLALGLSYVDHLQAQRRQQNGSKGSVGSGQEEVGDVHFSFSRLQQQLVGVFGGWNVALWLLPRWRPLPGVLASSKKAA